MKISVKSALIFLVSGLVPLAAVSLVGYDQLRGLALDKAHAQVRQEALRMVGLGQRLDERQPAHDVGAGAQPAGHRGRPGAAGARFGGGAAGLRQHLSLAHGGLPVRHHAASRSRAATASAWSRWVTNLPPSACCGGAAAADSAVIGTADGVPSILFANAVKPYGSLELTGLVGARATVGEITRHAVTPRAWRQAGAGADGDAGHRRRRSAGALGLHSRQEAEQPHPSAPEFVAASARQGVVGFEGPRRPDGGLLGTHRQRLGPAVRTARSPGAGPAAARGPHLRPDLRGGAGPVRAWWPGSPAGPWPGRSSTWPASPTA
jgi:hypothetical protein